VIGQAADVLSRKSGSPRATGKHRHTAIKAHVGVGDPSKQCLNKFVDGLPRLLRQGGEPLLQRGIESDRSAGHTPHCAMSTSIAQFVGDFDVLMRL